MRAPAIRRFFYEERGVFLAFVVSRLLLFALAWLAYQWISHGEYLSRPGADLGSLFHRWDADWYYRIIRNGYSYEPGRQSNIAFFPLMPGLTWLVTLCGLRADAAGMVISNSCLLGACVLVRRYAALDFPAPSQVPMRTVLLLLLNPLSVFHSALYTESLFLLLSSAALYAARKGNWMAAGLTGALLSATRVNGIFLVPALLWEIWHRVSAKDWRPSLRSLIPFAWILVVPTGLLAYMGFLFVNFGEPLAFAKTQAAWGRKLCFPWETIAASAGMYHFPDFAFFLVGLLVAGVLFSIGCWLRFRPSLLIFTGLCLLIGVSATRLEAFPRFASVLFALPMALAAVTARSETAFAIALVSFSAFLALCTTLFAAGYFIT